MSVKIGIDLGTTYCAVAYVSPADGKVKIIPNLDGKQLTPSVICIPTDGSAPLFGEQAKEEQTGGAPDCVSSFKRMMDTTEKIFNCGGKDYSAEDMSSMLLGYLKAGAEAGLHDTVDSAVITVPAYFGDPQRRATWSAAERAGLKVIRLLDEPVAAAMAYGIEHWREGNMLMVYDLGGGTFDVSILKMLKIGEFVEMDTEGDHRLGGLDWDNEMYNLICDKLVEQTDQKLYHDIFFRAKYSGQLESIKQSLSNMMSYKCDFYVDNVGKQTVVITRDEFEQRCMSLVERTLDLCRKMLKRQNTDWDKLSDILLVGGSTRMPMISAALERQSGRKPLACLNPDSAVAFGAAIQTQISARQEPVIVGSLSVGKRDKPGVLGIFGKRDKPPAEQQTPASTWKPQSSDATSLSMWTGSHNRVAHSLGVIALNEDATRYINRIIIPQNTEVPCKSAESFYFHTRRNGDNKLEIYLLQGEDKTYPLNNKVLACYVVDGIRHVQGGRTVIHVQYSYDESSITNVQVRQGDDTVDLPIHREPNPRDIDKYGLPPEKMVVAQTDPMNVMMALDVSGSMAGAPIENAKRAMKGFIDQLSDNGDVSFAITVVSDHVAKKTDFTPNSAVAKKAVDSIVCGETGVCNAAHPFILARDMFARKSGKNVMVVLADGMWEHQSEAELAAKKCHAAGTEICAIGFGSADKRFLDSISSSDQMSIFKHDSSGLTEAFGTIAQVMAGGQSNRSSGREQAVQETQTWSVVANPRRSKF